MSNQSLKRKRVLVTGVSGFIGSHMAARLAAEGAEVFALAREGSDLWRIHGIQSQVQVYRADLRNREQTFASVQTIQPEYVFHMAAYGVDSRQKDYHIAAETNIMGTINLLSALRNTNCRRILNIGSCMEYGDKQEIIREDSFLEPFNIYGSTKASATIMAHQLAQENGIDIITLRAFGIFGENEGSHKFFPHIILSILMGGEVNLTACQQSRDYCYIDNLMDGFIGAAQAESIRNEVMNIGTGVIHSLKYYVDLVYRQMKTGKTPNYGAIPYRKDEVWRPQPDIGKIQALLGWEPRIGLEEGLARTISWYRANLSIYQGTGR